LNYAAAIDWKTPLTYSALGYTLDIALPGQPTGQERESRRRAPQEREREQDACGWDKKVWEKMIEYRVVGIG
jgi:hypothetical protein